MKRRQFIALSGSTLGVMAVAGMFTPGVATQAGETTAAAWARKRKYLPLDVGQVAYIDEGGGPVALFLHGFPLSSYQWRGAIARLSGRRRCLAPDSLGLGFTEVAEGQGVAPADQVQMLAAFLDRLGVESVDLVANDSGGAVAQLFMVKYPTRVRTVLLTNCDVEPDSPPPALEPVIELARKGTFPDEWLVPWYENLELARSPEGLAGLCYSKPGHPSNDALELYLGPLVSSARRKALTNAYTLGLTPNPLAGIEQHLRRLDMPVRIVWGSADTIFSSDSPGYLHDILRNSKGVRDVPGAKLFFPEEYPEIIAEEALMLWQTT
ncbi:alpha/beta fold hydrolase [Kordiimonas aestuarii]|uniref:alpha/beta fold hydrolase n=1 Tax=Kordiimonas aestuarii TaxID=1005925 RepID=UPI0021D22771|nr:alpha/beta hydrolase [Kordiimonas aestuarii]